MTNAMQARSSGQGGVSAAVEGAGPVAPEAVEKAVQRGDTSTSVPFGGQPGRPPRGAGRLGSRRRWTMPAAVGAAIAVIAIATGLIVPNAVQHRPQLRPALAAGPRHMAYVVGCCPDSVTPVNLATGTALPPIKFRAYGSPSGAAISPDGGTVYLATEMGFLVAVNTVNRTAGQQIRIGGQTDDMLMSPDGSTGYLLQSPYGVQVVDLALKQPAGFIKIHNASGFTLTPDGKTLYVVGGFGSVGCCTTVTPVDTATLKPLQPISAPANVRFSGRVAVTPDGKTAYVLGGVASGANSRHTSATLTPISTTTNSALAPIRLAANGHYGGPISFSPDSRTAYFGSSSGSPGWCNGATCTVTAVDLKTGADIWTASVPDTGIYPVETQISPDGKTIWALTPDITRNTNFGTSVLYQISATTGISREVMRVSVSVSLGILDFSPDGKTLYLLRSSDGSSAMLPIDAATGKAGELIPLPTSGSLLFGPS